MKKATKEALDEAADTAGLVWIPKNGITIYTKSNDGNEILAKARSFAKPAEALAYLQGWNDHIKSN